MAFRSFPAFRGKGEGKDCTGVSIGFMILSLMALDHFVPQVHLRQFCCPSLNGKLNAIRKSNLHYFTPTTGAICGMNEGNTNKFLKEPRLIENFLKEIEPKYPQSINNLIEGCLDQETIYTISGFVAYVLVCSPAGTRLNAGSFDEILAETARRLEKGGKFPPPPAGMKSLAQMLDEGAAKVVIDSKLPQSMGIANIIEMTHEFGNFHWEVMINECESSPFFTSDFPIAIEKNEFHTFDRIVPLSPHVAIRIKPNKELRNVPASFEGFSYKMKKISPVEAKIINSKIIRCAEETVFYRDNHVWVLPFVRRNARFRIENKSTIIKRGKGTAIISSLSVDALS